MGIFSFFRRNKKTTTEEQQASQQNSELKNEQEQAQSTKPLEENLIQKTDAAESKDEAAKLNAGAEAEQAIASKQESLPDETVKTADSTDTKAAAEPDTVKEPVVHAVAETEYKSSSTETQAKKIAQSETEPLAQAAAESDKSSTAAADKSAADRQQQSTTVSEAAVKPAKQAAETVKQEPSVQQLPEVNKADTAQLSEQVAKTETDKTKVQQSSLPDLKQNFEQAQKPKVQKKQAAAELKRETETAVTKAEPVTESVEEKTEATEQTASEQLQQAENKPAQSKETEAAEQLNTGSAAAQDAVQETAEKAEAAADTQVQEKKSFFERLKKTRQNISFGLEALIKGKQISEELYEDLETALLTADLGVETTNEVIEKLRNESKIRELHDAGALKENLKSILKGILKPCEIPLEIEKRDQRPYVILMVGVNGAGKTTTIGKLVQKYQAQNLKVMLAAGDTFRAAAVEQLKAWGERANVPVIAQESGSDSASVIFDALKSAQARSYDVLICDTAGRLQNKDHLMEELKKIVRVMKKIDETVPDEVMLVLDATTGQNAVSQTKLFSEAVAVTGLCITKLDGSAKGGVVFALADKFKIPVRYVGIGEHAEDLRTFKVDTFVDALIDE
ncbi:MAG: signal recognition particle-docking protein FtsY [Succinivibrio sp.]|nr:signal recognition particle-docking protein FtsY [Succinivibrio sp.]